MSTNTMKAIRLHAFGGPDVLRYEDAPLPALKAGEVLIRVHAVGVNPPDWYLREGYASLPPQDIEAAMRLFGKCIAEVGLAARPGVAA